MNGIRSESRNPAPRSHIRRPGGAELAVRGTDKPVSGQWTNGRDRVCVLEFAAVRRFAGTCQRGVGIGVEGDRGLRRRSDPGNESAGAWGNERG